MLLALFFSPFCTHSSRRSENNIEKYPELAELIDVLDFRAVATFFFLCSLVRSVIYCNISVPFAEEEMKKCTEPSSRSTKLFMFQFSNRLRLS
jgi:hypothetical protein